MIKIINYYYDASGERTVKLSGASQGVYYKLTSLTATVKARYDSLGVDYRGTPQGANGFETSASGKINTPQLYFYHPDHLGSSSLITYNNGLLVQHLQYLPFGEVFIDERKGSWHTPFTFSAKEEQDEETGLHFFGARYYDSRTSAWLSVDPLAEKMPWVSAYVYCLNNPVKYFDPDGRSTHTNQKGKVIAVYNDNNLGVYRHSDRSLKGFDPNKGKLSTKGAERMGESLHALSFVDQSLYNETGEVKAKANMTIYFNSTELTSKVNEILDSKPSLVEYAKKAGTNGDWDIKSKVSNGSLLYGKYASPRDAGNFAAGAVAQMSGIEPVAQFGYGAYNLTGNSKPLTGLMTFGVGALIIANPSLGLTAAGLISKFGEDKLSQRSIDLGKQFILNK